MVVSGTYPYDRDVGASTPATLRVITSSDSAVSSRPAQTSNAPSSAVIQTAAGDVLTSVAGQRIFIQNLGVNPLFVRRATGASSSAFHYCLQGAGANDDGTGGAVEITDHIGVVSVAGTSPRFNAWAA